jgi:RNA-directed DNA polymerase
METLRAAYEMAKRNDGAPGIDGVTFEAIEAQGVEAQGERQRQVMDDHALPVRGPRFPACGRA